MNRAELIYLGDDLAARRVPGAADGVLWIHGYTLDSSSWEPLWELLPGWHHVGVDLPGHGASLPLRPEDDLPGLGLRIAELARAWGLRHLVALSFGTVVALQVALAASRTFASLILAAPSFGGGPQDPDVATRYSELERAYRERGPGPHLRELWMTSPPDLFRGAEGRPQLWQRLWRLVGRHGWWELADGSYGRLGRHPQTRADLARIRAATLLVVGERELPAFKRSAELIRRAVPGAQRRYVPELGHLCLVEDPPKVAPLVAEHLQLHAKTTPET